MSTMTRNVKVEDLRPGMTFHLLGRNVTITHIEPYTGPLADIVFAIAHFPGITVRESGMSLCHGDIVEVIG